MDNQVEKIPARWIHQLQLQRAELCALRESLGKLTLRVEGVDRRLGALEPVIQTDISQSAVRVPVEGLGQIYTESSLLQCVFSPDGQVTYNGESAERPPGFARGTFPGEDPGKTQLFFGGDDVGEKDLSLYTQGLFLLAQRRANGEDVPVCFFTRAGRERTPGELVQDASLAASASVVVLDRCIGTSLGYASLIEFCVHLAHGRAVYVIERENTGALARFDAKQYETNFIGPRHKLTERERQDQIARFYTALVQPYCKQMVTSGPERSVTGVQRFVNEILFPFQKALLQSKGPDTGYVAAWLASCPSDMHSDVVLVAKAMMACILKARGSTSFSSAQMAEHERTIMEIHHTTYKSSCQPRNVVRMQPLSLSSQKLTPITQTGTQARL